VNGNEVSETSVASRLLPASHRFFELPQTRGLTPFPRREIMTQECILTGRIARLAIFRVSEFGPRASFHLECAGRPSAICAVAGNLAREFITHFCEGDLVVVRGFHEPRPSTAAANTPWLGRFRVRDIRVAEDVLFAA
jgi:hypothetical protein